MAPQPRGVLGRLVIALGFCLLAYASLALFRSSVPAGGTATLFRHISADNSAGGSEAPNVPIAVELSPLPPLSGVWMWPLLPAGVPGDPSNVTLAGSGAGIAAAPHPLTAANVADAFWMSNPAQETHPAGVFGPQQMWWRGRAADGKAGNGTYHLNLEQLERSFLPAGDMCTWRRVFDLLDGGANVTIVVIGGSMTYGINCAPAHADYLCSWPNEIRMWLQLIRPRWNLQLLIQGYGGVHAGQFATDPRLIPADIYVVDTLVNSIQVHVLDVPSIYDLLMWRLTHQMEAPHGGPPAILSLQTMPAYWRLMTADAESKVAEHYGIPVSSFRQAILPGHNESIAPEEWAKVEYMWRDGEKYGQGGVTAYGTHPGKSSHELVSDVVKYAFLRLLSNRSSGASGRSRDPTDPTLCAAQFAAIPPATGLGIAGGTCVWREGGPLVSLSPTTDFTPLSVDGWRLYEDVRRKPGWIAGAPDDPPRASNALTPSLAFNVSFTSKEPRLELGFLQSYVGMGAARFSLAIGSCNWRFVLNASITERFSVSQTAVLGSGGARMRALAQPHAGSGSRALLPAQLSLGIFPECSATRAFASHPSVTMEGACDDSCTPRPGIGYTLRVEAPVGGIRGKFKLLSIISC